MCSVRPCGVGAGRRLNGALCMHGNPAVCGCGMAVVFVRCRQRLKYITKEIHVIVPIPATAARQGGKVAANLVDLCEL